MNTTQDTLVRYQPNVKCNPHLRITRTTLPSLTATTESMSASDVSPNLFLRVKAL